MSQDTERGYPGNSPCQINIDRKREKVDAKVLNTKEEFLKWGLIGTIVWGIIIALVFIVIQLFTMGAYT